MNLFLYIFISLSNLLSAFIYIILSDPLINTRQVFSLVSMSGMIIPVWCHTGS